MNYIEDLRDFISVIYNDIFEYIGTFIVGLVIYFELVLILNFIIKPNFFLEKLLNYSSLYSFFSPSILLLVVCFVIGYLFVESFLFLYAVPYVIFFSVYNMFLFGLKMLINIAEKVFEYMNHKSSLIRNINNFLLLTINREYLILKRSNDPLGSFESETTRKSFKNKFIETFKIEDPGDQEYFQLSKLLVNSKGKNNYNVERFEINLLEGLAVNFFVLFIFFSKINIYISLASFSLFFITAIRARIISAMLKKGVYFKSYFYMLTKKNSKI